MFYPSKIPVNLPPRVAKNDEVTAFWANSIREAIWRLSQRKNFTGGGGGGGGGSDLAPWQPIFRESGGTYYATINLGTINGVAATNWNTEHTLSMGPSSYYFIVATVTTSSGKVTAVSLSIDASAPSEDSIAKNAPPTTFYVVLGAIGETTAKMIHVLNLNAEAAEVFREGKSAPAVGAEPFERWWRWNLDTV